MRGQHDADRMGAPHQRHRDADEAGAGGEVEQQPVLHAHDLVDGDQPGQRAGDQHGDDDDARRARCRHRRAAVGLAPTARIS